MYLTTRSVARSRISQTSVQSSSPLELVVLLYDGALRHLVAAREAIDRQDLITRREALSKALAIVTELQSTLNLEEGGAVAQQLDGCTPT